MTVPTQICDRPVGEGHSRRRCLALVCIGREERIHSSQRFRRFYMDTPYPFIHTRFIWGYIAALGGYLDALSGFVDSGGRGDAQRLGVVFRSPSLLAKAFFGYYFPGGDNMILSFRSERSRTSGISRSPSREIMRTLENGVVRKAGRIRALDLDVLPRNAPDVLIRLNKTRVAFEVSVQDLAGGARRQRDGSVIGTP